MGTGGYFDFDLTLFSYILHVGYGAALHLPVAAEDHLRAGSITRAHAV